MAQFSVRLDDDLADQVKAHAAAASRSVNGWIVALIGAAVDPELADSQSQRTRERLARAGLLVLPESGGRRTPPDPERLRRARRAAGGGTPLSDLVSAGRD